MANPNISLSLASDNDNDSDAGVLLSDVDSRRRHEQFTFNAPLPGKIYSTQAILLCNQSTTRTPHHHGMSAKQHLTSVPGNFAFDVSRRNVAQYQLDRKSEVEAPTPSLEDITRLLHQMTVTERLWTLSEMTSSHIQRYLHRLFRYDPYFMRECRERHETNPYPDIDLNIGWNRERYDLESYFLHRVGTVEERVKGWEEQVKARDSLAQFSLTRQLDSLVLSEDVFASMFKHLFVGAGRDKSGWSREPGSWWGARKRLFSAGCGDLAEIAKKTAKRIKQHLDLWKSETSKKDGEVSRAKRSHLVAADESEAEWGSDMPSRPGKRSKDVRGKSEEVMSEAWRARRRLQEKKAGRWTDGTLRMDRMWIHYHWVLNVDDPRENTWGDQ
jgi:hypothetical protein